MKVRMTIEVDLSDDEALQVFIQSVGATGVDDLKEAIHKSFSDDMQDSDLVKAKLIGVEIEP